MIDYIKLTKRLNQSEEKLLKKSIDFYSTYNIATGAEEDITRQGKVKGSHNHTYEKNLKIRLLHKGWCEISGSIHKYHNNGEHNFNQFTKLDFEHAVNELCQRLDINIWQFNLSGVEFGVNLKSHFSTEQIMSSLIRYKNKEFLQQRHDDEGDYKQAVLTEYKVKAYDKRQHYESQGYEFEHDIFRFELKYNSLRSLKALGIYQLEDLKERMCLLTPLLLKAWDNTLFFDDSIKKSIKPEQFNDYSNQRFWNKRVSKKQSSYRYHCKKLRIFNEKYGMNIHSRIRGEIQTKLNDLV